MTAHGLGGVGVQLAVLHWGGEFLGTHSASVDFVKGFVVLVQADVWDGREGKGGVLVTIKRWLSLELEEYFTLADGMADMIDAG